MGPFCEACTYNWYKQTGGFCADCTLHQGSVSASVAIPVAIVAALVAAVIGQIATKGEEEAKAKKGMTHMKTVWSVGMKCLPSTVQSRIGISLVQVISQIGTVFNIRFPPVFSELIRVFGLVQLDFFSFVPVGCVFPDANFYSTLLMSTLIPIGIVAVLGLSGQLLHCAGKTAKGALCFNHIFTLLFLVYPSTSTKIFSTFQCYTIDDGQGNVLGRFLRTDFSIDCDASAHTPMQIYAGLMMLVYPLGVPALYAYLFFFRYGKEMKQLRAFEIASKNLRQEVTSFAHYERYDGKTQPLATPADTLAAAEKIEDESDKLLKSLPTYVSKLLSGYDHRTYYFEIAECVRKQAMVSMPVFFEPAGSPAQLITGLLVCFITSAGYSMLEPYAKRNDNWLAAIAQLQIFFTLLSAIALSFSPAEYGNSAGAMDMLLSFMLVVPAVCWAIMEGIKRGCTKEDGAYGKARAHAVHV